jgi:hypothetical protein
MNTKCMLLVPISASAIAILLSACATSGTSAVPGASHQPTDPNKVQVLYQAPSRPYEVIGFVSVDKTIGVSDEDVTRKFREAGAKLGAQAVIVDSLPVASILNRKSILSNQAQGKGKAIRWK